MKSERCQENQIGIVKLPETLLFFSEEGIKKADFRLFDYVRVEAQQCARSASWSQINLTTEKLTDKKEVLG